MPIRVPRTVAARPAPSTRLLFTIIAVVALVLGSALPALAHVELASSSPAQGARLVEAPSALELEFSVAAEPAGDGIVLRDAAGEEVEAAVTQVSPTVVTVEPQSELPNGGFTLSWTMRAGDAHPRNGSVAFAVADLAAADPTRATGDGLATQSAQGVMGLPSAQADPAMPAGERVGVVGRWLAMTGVLLGVGALAFAVTSLVGSAREIQGTANWIRRAGVAVVAGSIIELVGSSWLLAGSLPSALLPGSLLDVASGPFGFAVFLRAAGGVALVRGVAPTALPVRHQDRDAASGGGATALLTRTGARLRFDLDRSLVAVGGAAAVVASYVFDGHTVTASPAPLVRIAAVVHVAAAGVWIGGVLMLGWVLAGRRARRIPLEAAELAVRFSRVAAGALVATGVAGLALAWAILDSPGELVSTPWGRVLLAKLALVGVAASLGGYNHKVVVPALEASEDDSHGHLLAKVVRIESVVLLLVVVATAVLVGAAS